MALVIFSTLVIDRFFTIQIISLLGLSQFLIVRNITLLAGLCGNEPHVEVGVNLKTVMAVTLLFHSTKLSY